MFEEKPASNEIERIDALVPGSHFDGKFSILELIASGANGKVYKAEHLVLTDLCAVKVLRRELVLDETSRARFSREALIASKLRHPNLVQMRAYGISPDGLPYLAMDYIEGVTLQERLQSGPLDISSFRSIFLNMLDALAYAHENFVIHRDIKPANILILPDGSARLIDLGLAKIYDSDLAVSDGGRTITSTGALPGTPLYMSPEQCKGAALTPQSDIYSVAVVMFECVCGQAPFRADSDYLVMQAHLQEPAVFPSGIKVPGALRSLILACLSKELSMRPESAREVLEELSKIDMAVIERGSQITKKKLLYYSLIAFCLPLLLCVVLIRKSAVDPGQLLMNRTKHQPLASHGLKVRDTDSSQEILTRLKELHEVIGSHQDLESLKNRLRKHGGRHRYEEALTNMLDTVTKAKRLGELAIKAAEREGDLDNLIAASIMHAEVCCDLPVAQRCSMLKELEESVRDKPRVSEQMRFRTYYSLADMQNYAACITVSTQEKNEFTRECKFSCSKALSYCNAGTPEWFRSQKMLAHCCFCLNLDSDLERTVADMLREPDARKHNLCMVAQAYLAQRYAETKQWSKLHKIMQEMDGYIRFADDDEIARTFRTVFEDTADAGRSKESAHAERFSRTVFENSNSGVKTENFISNTTESLLRVRSGVLRKR